MFSRACRCLMSRRRTESIVRLEESGRPVRRSENGPADAATYRVLIAVIRRRQRSAPRSPFPARLRPMASAWPPSLTSRNLRGAGSPGLSSRSERRLADKEGESSNSSPCAASQLREITLADSCLRASCAGRRPSTSHLRPEWSDGSGIRAEIHHRGRNGRDLEHCEVCCWFGRRINR